MVQIDTIVCSSDQRKPLIPIPTLRNSPTAREDSRSEYRFKIVHPYSKNQCNNCLFFTLQFLLNNPVISFCVFLLLLVSFSFLGPVACYIQCNFLAKFGHGNTLKTNPCFSESANQYRFVNTNHNYYSPLKDRCINILDSERFDCLPRANANEQECYGRGCCWAQPINGSKDAPLCFFPSEYRNYKYINVSATDMGAVAYLKIIFNSTFPENIPIIRIDFNYWTEDVLQVKIYDANRTRYETPFPELPTMGTSAAKSTKYVVAIDEDIVGFRIIRKSSNQTIFNTQDVGGLIFSDQLLQLSAYLPSSQLYGLGQQRNNFSLNVNWTTITLFNHDEPPKDRTNLYGTHPFYLVMEEGGLSNGVLLLNSNAMDIVLTPAPAITYRTIGGVLDFFFFLGPSPADVLRQYTQLVGRPFLPPYWSLGFHLCKFGYNTLNETIKVWNRTRAAEIPFDTQWNDIDYMQNRNDFTYDGERFKGLPEFVDLLHKEGMHYMMIVDPGVSSGEIPGTYPPFDQGMAQRVFVMDSSSYLPFEGKVWNKESTVFVDFFNPASVSYWLDQLRRQHDMYAFDGVWIDMNDPSNFLNGARSGCPNTTLDHPPYIPGVTGGELCYRTLCMSAKHHNNVPHYDLHNVYGLAEAIVTSFAMQQLRGKRAFVISRSSFPGQGHYSGVWTGDITSSWEDMAQSVSDILSFSLFGVPMSGADICGFNGNTTVALCQRWSQLGAFYPFSRNHNSDVSSAQDPVALGPAVVGAARKALLVRYSLLPYLYTLLWHAHDKGDTVVRPMFVEFPGDHKTYDINTQFLWGPALLIAPVLKEGAVNVGVYLPVGQWYDFYSFRMMQGNGTEVVVPAPLDTIPLMLRGGFVVPTQRPNRTTTLSRLNPIDLLVALDDKEQAVGDLYWDDGDSLEHNDGVYNLVRWVVGEHRLRGEVLRWQYTISTLRLGQVQLLGVHTPTHTVNVNGNSVPFQYNSTVQTLIVRQLDLDLNKPFEMTWE